MERGSCLIEHLWYDSNMTKLFEEGIQAVRQLPADRQDAAGELLLSLATEATRRYQLSAEQIAGIRDAQAQAKRREFASDKRMQAVFSKRFV